MVLEALVILRFLKQPLKDVLVERAAWRTPSERRIQVMLKLLFYSGSHLTYNVSNVWICYFQAWFRGRTRIPSDIDGVVGVACVGARVRALCLALTPVHHQLRPVPELLGGDRVPLAVAEALALGRVLRADPSSAVVHVEEQLQTQEANEKHILYIRIQ